ncbi:6342_t:CDS:2, partial [Rhizophagus irregularis]
VSTALIISGQWTLWATLQILNSRLLIEITDLRNEYAKIKAENTKLKHVIEEKAELRSRFEELERRNKVDTDNLIAENAALKIRQPERLVLETYVSTSYPLGRTSSKGLSKCVPNAAQPRSLHKEVIGTQVPRSTQTQEFIPTHSEEKMPQELNMVIQPCNRSHKKKGMDELKHELFKPFSEPDIDEASQHLAQLCDKAIDAEERANRANQEEILCCVQNNTSPKNEVNVSATPNDLLLIKNESDIDADDSRCSDPHTLRDIPAFTSIPVTMRESNRWKGDTLSSDSSSDSSSETETESCTDSESEYNDYDAAEFYIKSF